MILRLGYCANDGFNFLFLTIIVYLKKTIIGSFNGTFIELL